MQMSFGSVELEQQLKRDSILTKINALVDWKQLRPNLSGLYKREQSRGGGQEPFDTLMISRRFYLGNGIVCRMRHWNRRCTCGLIFCIFAV